jgi:putative protein kinase ArgK-like GTPase of G3E family
MPSTRQWVRLRVSHAPEQPCAEPLRAGCRTVKAANYDLIIWKPGIGQSDTEIIEHLTPASM